MEQIIFARPRTSGNGLPTNETHFTMTMVVFPPPQAKKIHLSTMFRLHNATRSEFRKPPPVKNAKQITPPKAIRLKFINPRKIIK